LRMPQVQGVEGEAVVCYAEPLTTQEMRYHRLSRMANNMAGFSLFVDVTPNEFAEIAQERRNMRLSLLFRTLCHVVYATLGFILSRSTSTSSLRYASPGLRFHLSENRETEVPETPLASRVNRRSQEHRRRLAVNSLRVSPYNSTALFGLLVN
jgi:hypothetical protein